MRDDIFRGYAAAASQLVPRFEAITPALLYEPVIDLFPTTPSRIADIGAGTGRDAAWLTGKGHSLVAVEPVAELRNAGMDLHRALQIEWLDDRLPELRRTEGPFDCLVLSAVWQHLDNGERRCAMHRLSQMMSPHGLLIMSLRHGIGAPTRRTYEAAPEDTIQMAEANGFKTVRRKQALSVQARNQESGVYWTWLVFRFFG